MFDIDLIAKWHHDRNLIDGAIDQVQYKKLMSEFGELSDNLAKGRCIKDDIGDCGVVIVNIAERNDALQLLKQNHKTFHAIDYMDLLDGFNSLGQTVFNENERWYSVSIQECVVECWELLKAFAKANNLDFDECLSVAYDDIKHRKGKMINGTFVKESDL